MLITNAIDSTETTPSSPSNLTSTPSNFKPQELLKTKKALKRKTRFKMPSYHSLQRHSGIGPYEQEWKAAHALKSKICKFSQGANPSTTRLCLSITQLPVLIPGSVIIPVARLVAPVRQKTPSHG
ncbi:unnamed protein product [Lathyrus sativus]|nr:unnamed protein product [Lathyrus sativus]